MSTGPEDQTALDERVIESSELEKALEDREVAKGSAGEARKKFETLNDLVKGEVEKLGLEDDDAVRVGRFRIAKKAVPSRAVSFETDPTSKLTIGVTGEDE